MIYSNDVCYIGMMSFVIVVVVIIVVVVVYFLSSYSL